ncbi:phospho-N-acetylmuramoyl-pentapeptide-transferase [Christensenella tenuis]|uniref:Phospho-N-acetylmuramoyl-pentapeptide-transferase n=1 Tax=Christensenella tenuis TaxID=2763033 RepID=A0ABR7EC31_9FIRM|nr:phospho-N-acetylmuramoyl-pentapeptide-transferase [Christensenella tenuis]MBC5647325.1 phospho-N-acetylmuramoyl-pentapeptide-transferase [Christensenella tenuis]
MNFIMNMLLTVLIAFAITFVASKILIPILKKAKAGQHVRDDGPQTHLVKEGTPTMGGIAMLVGIIASSFIFSSGDIKYTLFALITVLAFALIGFLDDGLKLFKKRSLGLRAWQKIVLQLIAAAVAACLAYYWLGIDFVAIPLSASIWQMGWGFIPFTMFVLLAMVNSVNLTDGLDGLATGITLINSSTFLLIFVLSVIGAVAMTDTEVVADMSNMTMFTAAVAGSCIAFLCFNAHPAKVFMGDTGAFALGAALTAMGIATGMQLFLPVMGFMFVLSAVSVIIQVGSFKLRGKRVFRMAPLHHHFELGGASETQVVTGYMIATTLLCVGAFLLFFFSF